MNDLRTRLDDLARRQTSHINLRDPSLVATEKPATPRLAISVAIVAAIAAFASLFAWQTGDNVTSLASGGDGEATSTMAEPAAAQNEPDADDGDAAAAVEAARIAAEEAASIEAARLEALGLDAPKTLAEARTLWEAAGITDYQLSYTDLRSEGMTTPVTMTVEDGRIRLLDYPGDLGAAQLFTVDAMFDLADSADNVRDVTFDPDYGYPTLLSVDPEDDQPGDELRLASVEMVPAFVLEDLDARIDAWLTAIGPIVETPDVIASTIRSQRSGGAAPDDMGESPAADDNDGGVEVRLLHVEPEFDVFVYRHRLQETVCAAVAFKSAGTDDEYTGESVGSCTTTTNFVRRSIALTNTPPDRAAYVLVLPALDDFGAGWVASVSPETGRLSVNDHSALLIVDEADVPSPGPDRVYLEIACECGDERHVLPFG